MKTEIKFGDGSALARAVASRLSNVTGLWVRVAAWLAEIKERYWGKGGAYGRDPWPPISETMVGRQRRGTNDLLYGRYSLASVPLHASGLYRYSFTSKLMTPDTLVWGSTHPMAKFLPEAGRGGRIILPDVSSQAFRTGLGKIVKTFIDDELKIALIQARGGE